MLIGTDPQSDIENVVLRFRLDVAELPKPLQVSAFGRKDWNLASDWYRWTFVAARESK